MCVAAWNQVDISGKNIAVTRLKELSTLTYWLKSQTILSRDAVFINVDDVRVEYVIRIYRLIDIHYHHKSAGIASVPMFSFARCYRKIVGISIFTPMVN